MMHSIYILLSQWRPEYPGKHVQWYPVDPLTTHDPLFRHGEDEQMSTEITILIVTIFYYLVSLCFYQLILREAERNNKNRNPSRG